MYCNQTRSKFKNRNKKMSDYDEDEEMAEESGNNIGVIELLNSFNRF